MLFLSAVSHLTCSTNLAEQKPNFQIGFMIIFFFTRLFCCWFAFDENSTPNSTTRKLFHCVTKISRFVYRKTDLITPFFSLCGYFWEKFVSSHMDKLQGFKSSCARTKIIFAANGSRTSIEFSCFFFILRAVKR